MKMRLFFYSLCAWTVVAMGGFAHAAQPSYANRIQPGLNLIANQLDHGGDTFNDLFPNPDGAQDGNAIWKYNCSGRYTIYYFDSGSPTGWDDEGFSPVAAPTLVPGEGAFFDNES